MLKDIGKLILIIGGLSILLSIISYLLGGTSSPNSMKYYLYEYETAEDNEEERLITPFSD